MLTKIKLNVLLLGAFVFFSLLALLFSVHVIKGLRLLEQVNKDAYNHPFTVSNTVRSINNHITSMHRYMKDVVLAENQGEIDTAIEQVRLEEKMVRRKFLLVQVRFLGESVLIDNAKKAFEDWQVIRNEVIQLMLKGERNKAALITKGKGASHVKWIEKEMDNLLRFANKKAAELVQIGSQQSDFMITTTIVLFFIFFVLAGVGFYVFYNSFMRQINQLTEASLALTKGDYETKITDLGRNEMGVLGNHFEIMRRTIVNVIEELKLARDEAQTANKAKSTFLANMSHEIRTPLNAILGYTHLLKQVIPEEHLKDKLEKISISSNHLLAIINDILDISKIDAGKLALEKQHFNLSALFNQIQSLMHTQAMEKNIEISIDHDSVPEWLYGDETRIRQIVLNFMGNAIKFTKNGKVCLRAKKLETKEQVVTVYIEVQDSGIGIAEDKIAGLFKEFEQGDSSITRLYGGTGLGLAISQRLVHLMGGEIGVKSQVGVGSTFWFFVDLEMGNSNRVNHHYQKEPIEDIEERIKKQYQNRNLLLVEDNPINRDVAEELLCGVGFDVETAHNGLDAIEKIKAHPYDLILMDIQMPKMDGIQATTIIRNLEQHNDIPILAMTANVFEEDKQRCFSAGINDFVAKPIEPSNLFTTLIKYLLPNENNHIQHENLWQQNESVGQVLEDSLHPIDINDDEEVSEQKKLAESSVENHLNLGVIRHSFADNRNSYFKYLLRFKESCPADVDVIKNYAAQKDAEQLSFQAHRLKSSARLLGADNMADICFSIEMESKNENWDALNPLVAHLEKELELLNDLLESGELV